MATTPLFLAQNRGEQTLFVPGFAQRPRVIFTPGNLGSQIIGINLASVGPAGTVNVQLGVARKLTAEGTLGTGAFVDGGGGDDSITRSTGSFITDGWRVGDRMVAQEASTLDNDFEALLTAAAATTLSFATATVASAENFLAGTFLARWAYGWNVAVPTGSGVSTGAVSGMETADAPFFDGSPNRRLELGPNDLLMASLDTTMLTSQTLDISVVAGDY